MIPPFNNMLMMAVVGWAVIILSVIWMFHK
jgi:hypothetical protein